MAKADSDQARPGKAGLDIRYQLEPQAEDRVKSTDSDSLAEIIAFLGSDLSKQAEKVPFFEEGARQVPAGVSESLYLFISRLKKQLNADEEHLLWQFASRLLNSNELSQEERLNRAGFFADWAVREILPLALAESTLPDRFSAARLRHFAPITDPESAEDAIDLVLQISAKSKKDALRPGSNPGSLKTSGSPAQTSAAIAAIAAYASSAAKSLVTRPGSYNCSWFAAVHAANAANRAEAAGVNRETLIQMRIDLLDRICPAPAA